jgi:mxaC protein
MPRRDLAPWAYGLALACVLVLLGANLLEVKRWR